MQFPKTAFWIGLVGSIVLLSILKYSVTETFVSEVQQGVQTITDDAAKAATDVFVSGASQSVSFDQLPSQQTSVTAETVTTTTTPAKSECDYLKDMVKYLMIIIQMHEAQHEVYKLSNGYAMTFNSPKLEALRRQRSFFIEKVKNDPNALAFFRENLSLPL